MNAVLTRHASLLFWMGSRVGVFQCSLRISIIARLAASVLILQETCQASGCSTNICKHECDSNHVCVV